MTELVVLGAGGMLGRALVEHLAQHAPLAAARADVDVTNRDALQSFIPEGATVINASAYTDVDGAESDEAAAFAVNADAVRLIAETVKAKGGRLIHISTDYVFDGSKGEPYLPSDPVSPLGAYAKSKVAAEEAVLSVVRTDEAPHMIVRTGWLYGHGRRDFVDLVLDRTAAGDPLRIVDDQWGRPTWTRNVVGAVLDLIDGGSRGVVNVSDGGVATWHGFATAIVEEAGLRGLPEAVSSRDYGAPAERPLYTVLDLVATEEELGREMMPWRDALRTYLDERSSA